MNEKVKDILEWIVCIIIALVLALLFRYFIASPTIVQQRSMYPTFKSNQRLIINRTFRITKKVPKVGDVVTFESPCNGNYQSYSQVIEEEINQDKPIAEFNEIKGFFSRFLYYNAEITKKSYIKRVIATEGQHVEIKEGKVYIDGTKLDESKYLAEDVVTESNVYNDFVVPQGHFFCMGDNRKESKDCRMFGCIPLEKIEGIVIFRFWPLNDWGGI